MLSTSRLTLSPPSQSDAGELLSYHMRNRNHLKQWEPERSGDFFTLASMERRIHDMACATQAGQSLHLFLRDNVTGVLMGECGFTNIVRGPFQACHLGFSLGQQFQGHGLMHEALTHAIAFIFSKLDLHRIMANYRPENMRSHALLQRLGFQHEGHARSYLKIDGQWRDHLLSSLINPAHDRDLRGAQSELAQQAQHVLDESSVFRIRAPDMRCMRRERVRIVRWLRELLPDAEVREVGSTVLPGLIGKQDLDFSVKVYADKFEDARTRLDAHFIRNPDQLSNHCIQGYKVASCLDLALQLIVRDSPYDVFDSFLCLLRQDATLRDNYNRLKMQWDGKPMRDYRQAKDAFIALALSTSRTPPK